jgi:hypothetical protein
MEDTNFSICPLCKADMTQEGLTYVETGCTNYTNYIKNTNNEWEILDSTEGENPNYCYYACRSCGKQLPTKYQDHFLETL